MDSQAVESEVLRRFYYDIQTAITPSTVGIAALLYQEGVVPKAIKDEAGLSKPSVEKSAATILGAVETAVQTDPRNFWVLVAVLESFSPVTARLADRMREAVDLHASGQEVKKNLAPATAAQDSASPHTEEKDTESKSSSPQGVVKVSEVYKRDFCKIQDKFVKLFLDVTNILRKEDRVTLEDLKELLTSFPELEPPLQDADTILKVMRVVQHHCSFITYNYLYAVADHCNITEIRERVDAFDQLVEEFCKHTLRQHSYVESFLANPSKHLLPSETIIFKLEWAPDEKTLNDIQGLLRKTFESLASHIRVVVVRGCSVEVICYAPLYLMGALVKLARERRKMLVESKVTYLSLGYAVVLDNSVEKISALEEEVSSLKKKNETLQMKLRVSVGERAGIHCQISALEEEVSSLKKKNETLQMNLRVSMGERAELQLLLESRESRTERKEQEELKSKDKPQETPLEPVESSTDVSAQEEKSLLEEKVFTLKQEKEELQLKLKHLQDALTERDQQLQLLKSKVESAVLKPELQEKELEMRTEESQVQDKGEQLSPKTAVPTTPAKPNKMIVYSNWIHKVVSKDEEELESFAKQMKKKREHQKQEKKMQEKVQKQALSSNASMTACIPDQMQSEEATEQPEFEKQREQYQTLQDVSVSQEVAATRVPAFKRAESMRKREKALKLYEEQQDVSTEQVKPSTLVDPEKIIGAKPYRQVTLNDDKKGLVLVIKCSNDSSYQLKPTDPCYHQVQAQLYAGKTEGFVFCDFVTYTDEEKVSVQRFELSQDWQDTCVPKVRCFCNFYDAL